MVKRTYQPKKKRRASRMGYRRKMRTSKGRKTIKNRRNKGRKSLSVSDR